jgi:hypothetical protein
MKLFKRRYGLDESICNFHLSNAYQSVSWVRRAPLVLTTAAFTELTTTERANVALEIQPLQPRKHWQTTTALQLVNLDCA